jgi:hypothetical protein
VWRAIICSSSVGTVGWYDEHPRPGIGERDDVALPLVRLAVEFDAQPLGAFENAFAHPPGVLANAATKDDGVDPLQDRSQPAKFASDAEDEIVDRLS